MSDKEVKEESLYWKSVIEQKDQEIAELNKTIETYISLVDDAAKEILEKDQEITELKAEISGLDDNLLLLE